jgi:hypothetical protein
VLNNMSCAHTVCQTIISTYLTQDNVKVYIIKKYRHKNDLLKQLQSLLTAKSTYLKHQIQ